MTSLLAATLRGEEPSWPGGDAVDLFCESAEQHGVLPLVAEALLTRPDGPAPFRNRLHRAAVRAAAGEAIRQAELAGLLASITSGGVTPLVMKGAALAYTHYSRPELRARVDSDLLVPPEARAQVHAALVKLGYEAVEQVEASLVMYQTTYRKMRDGVDVHLVDVHWRIANPQPFGDVLTYGELAAAAVPVAPLGPSARALAPVHALILAAVHRVAHHQDSDRLVWLYDIHLLADRLTPAEWNAAADLAASRGVGAICAHSLRLASARFGTRVPDSVLDTPGFGAASASEGAGRYLRQGRRHLDNVLADLRALPRWSDRARLVRQHLFPPARYMRDVYAPGSSSSLPVLYVLRAFHGARKWLARS